MVDDYIDYALVRDALIETQNRRGFLTYEQKMREFSENGVLGSCGFRKQQE